MIPDAYTLPRRSERRVVRKAIVLVVETDGPETLHEGTTLDISDFGARVESEATLKPGQTLTLLQPEDPAAAFRCLVVWSGNVGSDGQGQMGLEFLDTLPPALEN